MCKCWLSIFFAIGVCGKQECLSLGANLQSQTVWCKEKERLGTVLVCLTIGSVEQDVCHVLHVQRCMCKQELVVVRRTTVHYGRVKQFSCLVSSCSGKCLRVGAREWIENYISSNIIRAN